MAEDKKQLSDLEARILYLLSNSSGNILDDEVRTGAELCVSWAGLKRKVPNRLRLMGRRKSRQTLTVVCRNTDNVSTEGALNSIYESHITK